MATELYSFLSFMFTHILCQTIYIINVAGNITFSYRQTTAWGRRVDDIVTCKAWQEQKRISAEEGLIAIPYENAQVN